MTTTKVADLAGPGISTYEEVEKTLPRTYRALLPPMERMKAVYAAKAYIEQNLSTELDLQMVQVPLIVDKESGFNDMLDRDGSRTPVEFQCGLGLDKRVEAQVVQAATKWKRAALKQFGCAVGQGINTDMRAIRKDYFLDHDHSSYVDQWDWEKVITAEDRNLDYLQDTVKKIWKVIYDAGQFLREEFPALAGSEYPEIPEELEFVHAEEILDRYPDLPRKERENRMLQEVAPALFITGIGWPLEDGYPHEMRAADYDDWVTETVVKNGKQMHGLNGDILVWNPVTKRRHELSSMGVRGHERDSGRADGDGGARGRPEAPVPPGHPERRDSALDRRGDRTVADLHVLAAHRPSGRGQRDRLAAGPQADLRQAQHSRARIGPATPSARRFATAAPSHTRGPRPHGPTTGQEAEWDSRPARLSWIAHDP